MVGATDGMEEESLLAISLPTGSAVIWLTMICSAAWVPAASAWSRTCDAAAPKSVPCGATRKKPMVSQKAERIIISIALSSGGPLPFETKASPAELRHGQTIR